MASVWGKLKTSGSPPGEVQVCWPPASVSASVLPTEWCLFLFSIPSWSMYLTMGGSVAAEMALGPRKIHVSNKFGFTPFTKDDYTKWKALLGQSELLSTPSNDAVTVPKTSFNWCWKHVDHVGGWHSSALLLPWQPSCSLLGAGPPDPERHRRQVALQPRSAPPPHRPQQMRPLEPAHCSRNFPCVVLTPIWLASGQVDSRSDTTTVQRPVPPPWPAAPPGCQRTACTPG